MRFQLSAIALATLLSSVVFPGAESSKFLAQVNHSFLFAPASAQTSEERQTEAAELLAIGQQNFDKNQFTAALEAWQQALEIYQEIGDRTQEARTLEKLGSLYDSYSDYPNALQYYQESLNIAGEIGDRAQVASVLETLGNFYSFQSDYMTAIEYFQQHLALAREMSDRTQESTALGNVGNIYEAVGDYTTAMEYYQQSLDVAKTISDRTQTVQALNNLGNAFYSQGNYPRAIWYYQQSLDRAREIGDRVKEGDALGNLGLAYSGLENYETALVYFQQDLAIARETNNYSGTGISLGNIGILYDDLGDYDTAIDYHQQNLAIARDIDDKDGQQRALNNLGVAFINAGRFNEAEETLREGIEIIEQIRSKLGNNDDWKVSFFEEESRTYSLLQQALIAQDSPEEALEISERSRARAFLELMAGRLGTQTNISEKVGNANLDQIKKIANEQNAVLVEYSLIFDEFLYIWVVQPTGEITFRSVDLNEEENTVAEVVERGYVSAATGRIRIPNPENSLLAQAVRGTRSGMSNSTEAMEETVNNAPRMNRNLQQLYQLLIDPIADLLPTDPNQNVIFIPQGELFLIPFPALQDANGSYLIQNHTITTIPAIQVLELTQQQQQEVNSRGEILIVGNPTMPKLSLMPTEPPQALSPLPGTEAEAEAIASLLNAEVLIGDRATETTIKEKIPQAKIVHLATHGILENTGNGMLAAIALTPGGNDDGLLTPNEILGLDLNADLVVLSACDTGRGRITGDGVVGLSRSILTAGSASVIVSLWQVPDEPTSALMSEFYRQWQQTGNKAQALRQAMLTTMEQYPHPMNWAAFTLMGESD